MVDDPRLTDAATSRLFQPISVGNLLLKNRVIGLPIGLLVMSTVRALQPSAGWRYRRCALEELVAARSYWKGSGRLWEHCPTSLSPPVPVGNSNSNN
jgi:hypothetical protein